MLKGFHKVSELPIKKGDKVRIPKGTKLRSMEPGKEPWEAGKSYTIEVDHVLNGSSKPVWNEETRDYEQVLTKNPTVRWAGSGRYWVEADINDVEKVEE